MLGNRLGAGWCGGGWLCWGVGLGGVAEVVEMEVGLSFRLGLGFESLFFSSCSIRLHLSFSDNPSYSSLLFLFSAVICFA